MHLRDYFAAQVAAALVHRVERPEAIASRAYELAEALLRERARRQDAEDDAFYERVIEAEEDEGSSFAGGLLDEPAPLSERERDEIDPRWFDRDTSVQLELEPRWNASPGSDRPGLARTAPAAAIDDKLKKHA